MSNSNSQVSEPSVVLKKVDVFFNASGDENMAIP